MSDAPKRVLHVLSQRPGRTGSGVTLDAFVRGASTSGWDQRVVVGTPLEDPIPTVGQLSNDFIYPLVFESKELPFPLPGMSDVMPYRSSVWSSMTESQLETYRTVWRRHLSGVIADFQPDVIHSHHIWLVSSMLKDIAPDVPVATSCHATGLRQMELCPHLANEVRNGCRRNDAFAVLHDQHALQLGESLDVSSDCISVVGAGFNEDVFHSAGRAADEDALNRIVYAGKYSQAKGLPWLLDAFVELRMTNPSLELHIAGTGSGEEADEIRARMEALSPGVVLHGQVSQQELADLLRTAGLFVLPSFYEGLPLVLVEAAACGCQLVCTKLPGVMAQLAEPLAERLSLVDLPRLASVDQPLEEDLPSFVRGLQEAISTRLAQVGQSHGRNSLSHFTWSGVFDKVEVTWQHLLHDD